MHVVFAILFLAPGRAFKASISPEKNNSNPLYILTN